LFLSHVNRFFWGIYGASAWDGVQLPIRRRIIKTVVKILKSKQSSADENVLDTGCGTGNYSIALAEEGFHVIGIDYSTGMLRCATSKVIDELAERLTFQQMNMNKKLGFPDSSFAHVISMTSLWTVADPRFTLSEFTRVLMSGGTLIVMQVPKPTQSRYSAIRLRIKYLEKKTPLVIALIAVKVLLERTKATKYWSPEELLALLLTNKELSISYVDHGPPIFIVATKI
jgi:ubiquinone/menaquinone biosynthesis C-methylase UbiE